MLYRTRQTKEHNRENSPIQAVYNKNEKENDVWIVKCIIISLLFTNVLSKRQYLMKHISQYQLFIFVKSVTEE